MFVFEYTDADFKKNVKRLGDKLGVTTEKDIIHYPEWFATGFSQVVDIEEGVQAHISDFILNTDYYLVRKASSIPFYVLRIHKTHITTKEITEGSNHKKVNSKIFSNVIGLYSNFHNISVLVPKGSPIKGVSVVFTADWLMRYLRVDSNEKLFQRYTTLMDNNLHFDLLNFQYRKVIDEIFESKNELLHQTIVINRVKLLIELFFDRMLKKLAEKKKATYISSNDVSKICQAEQLLVNVDPAEAPTISNLSKMVGMSPSSLKTKFKQVYQTTIYQYYQHNRLDKAMQMLLTGRYSVKETGLQLGFTNLSNFSAAFKKEFGVLPGKVISIEKVTPNH